MRIILIIFIINIHFCLQGQINNSVEPEQVKIVPPSIENYTFTKYGNLTINDNKGAFNTSIPLYEIKHGFLSIPISIDYFTTGIKVNDIAGLAGMNWNLNAGGMVTRVVKGEPDEADNKNIRLPRETVRKAIFGGYSQQDYQSKYKDILMDIWRAIHPNLEDLVDTQQDWFNFKFGKYSGNFYIENNKLYINSSTHNIKGEMTKISPSVIEFKFIMPTGEIYFLGGDPSYIESSKITNSCGNQYKQIYPTTWYLRKVQFETWEINFTYETDFKDYYLDFYEYLSVHIPCIAPGIISDETDSKTCINYFESRDAKYLKKINFGNSYVEFNYQNQRPDYHSGRILQNIIVYNSQNSKPIKNVELDYDVIQADKYTSKSPINSETVLNRVFLNKISINKNQNYLFEYKNAEKIPKRLSYSQDRFGYPNNNPSTYLININEYLSSENDTYSIFLKYFNNRNANRDVDPEKSLYGLLHKIHYPTGGNTIIEYENNKTYDKVSKIHFENSSISTEHYTCKINYQQQHPSTKSVEFISNGQNIFFRANASIRKCPNVTINDTHDIHSLKIEDLTTNKLILSKNNKADEPISGDKVIENTPFRMISVPTQKGHKYKITYSTESRFNDVKGLANIYYNKTLYSQYEEVNYSGARVKKITDWDMHNYYNIKKFIYNDVDSLQAKKTSLFVKEKFSPLRISTKPSEKSAQFCSGIYYKAFISNNYRVVSSQNQIEAINSRNHRINYSAITELSNKGAIEKKYYVDKDWDRTSFITNYILNYTPSESINSWKDGQVEEQSIYQIEKGSLKPLSKTFYEHTLVNSFLFDNYDITSGITMISDFIKLDLEGPYQTDKIPATLFSAINGRLGINHYYNRVFTSNITKKTNIEFLTNGNIKTTTQYNYDSPNHLQLTSEKVSTSTGELITQYQYPPDLAASHPLMQELTAQNRIAAPVSTEVRRLENGTEKQLSFSRIEYAKDATTSKLILPKFVYSKKGEASAEKKITYDRYDSHGNLLQYTPQEGLPVTIIWGYSQTYPIAKIEGATYSQIENQVENLQKLSDDANSSGLWEAFARLRAQLPGARITSYTYQPLVGVTSITAPNNLTEYYSYDSMGRLMQIKDSEGNLLKSFEYNYKSQN